MNMVLNIGGRFRKGWFQICLALGMFATFSSSPAAGSEILFEDDFEAPAGGGGGSQPGKGSYALFKAAISSVENQNAAPHTATGNVLRLERSQQMGTGHRRAIGKLERPALAGERLRLEFDARLESGSALQFGFGSKDGGIPMGGDHFYTIVISLSDTGVIEAYDGEGYKSVGGLVQSPGEWAHYVLDYVVGSDRVSLTVGKDTAIVSGPFAKDVARVSSVEELFVSTASDEVTGEFDNITASVVVGQAMNALPVFGRIVWTRQALPFVTVGPKGGISGIGMCEADGRIYLAGGFFGKGDLGDGSNEPNRKTSKWAYCFDVEAGRWDRLPDLPMRAEYGRMIAHQGKLYFVGGAAYAVENGKLADYRPSAAAHVLDLANVSQGWKSAPSLSVARTHFSLGRVGDLLLVTGGNQYDAKVKGYSPHTLRKETEILDLAGPGGGWVAGNSSPGRPRGWSGAAVAGGKLWIFGGLNFSFAKDGSKKVTPQRLAETLSYSPESKVWEEYACSPLEVSGWSAASYQDRYVILIGGYANEPGGLPRMNDFPLVYDTRDNRWMRFEESALPGGGVYNDSGVAIAGDFIFVAGGEGNGSSHFDHWLIGRIERSAASPVAKN